jgi:antitoxin (DNA-binding transcriptional repressor) of toxin-antitoxin stability system
MKSLISAKDLRSSLPKVVRQVRNGARFTVLYRSRPAFQIIPVDETMLQFGDLKKDSLYRAKPVGASKDGASASDHDRILYGG